MRDTPKQIRLTLAPIIQGFLLAELGGDPGVGTSVHCDPRVYREREHGGGVRADPARGPSRPRWPT